MKIKNMNRGVLSRLIALTAIAFCCVMALPMAARAEEAPEGQTEFHITNEADFISCVALSRLRDTSQWHVYLDNDIELDSDDMKAIVANTVKHLSFGNKEHPFRGVFDGQNHTVEGLNYDKDAFDPERDTGFFAETNGATIKNFLVKDANVWADFRGGIIVGKAVNTRFENVMVMESTLHVTCANNALNLITNAGFEGGLIAGELDGCILYNCEVRGGRAVNNTTSGVQALGGEGLYMAAFAGYVKNSTIEYCRVTPTRKDDGSIAEKGMTDVTNKYDVAIGALGGNNVYASGFVGCMAGDAKIIDCFSTAQCYSYAASYVGVVSVTRAWTGGLAGRILTEEGNELVRSHFAGDLSSRQYNPIAVIPIIQNDVNLGGIAARANKGDATVTECYFKPSVSLSGNSQGNPAKKKIPSFGGDGTTAGGSYGPWDDERYTTRELWEEHDYDFCAGTMRSTANGDEHANEWAMDYKLNIPVHGQSVKATIDFPGAGTATIEATKLGIDQATSDPYAFAVSAVLAGTAQGLAQGDTSVMFKQETSARPADLSEKNGGYRFMGWFRESNVNVNRIGQDNSWFDGKTDDAAVKDGKRVEKNANHDMSSTYKADNGEGVDEKYGFKGNDLFIASYEAQVLFYNVKGETLNWEDGTAHDKSTDWYRYGVGLTPAVPADRGSLKPTATFIGWTTQPSSEAEMNGGYAAITSTRLTELKNAGAFYPAGSEITVVGPTDFYPVYSDYASNIMTEFEGHEQDATDDKTQRDGVGKTHVKVETAEDGASAYTVQVLDVSGKAISKDGKLPDGYRFLGWYENKGTEDAPLEVRVSRDPSYKLPADVDLTVPHTYTARFEYRVDYYVRAYANDEYTNSELLCSVWNEYKTSFNEQVGTSYVRENVVHWGSEHVNHGDKNAYKGECAEGYYDNKTLIVAPMSAYSHNVRNDTGADTLKNVLVDTDFPGSGTLDDEKVTNALKYTFTPSSDRYSLRFWTLERIGGRWTYLNNPVTASINYTSKYRMRAMVTTRVDFYKKDGAVCKETTRRYESNLLQKKSGEEDPQYTYKYPFIYTNDTVDKNSGGDSDKIKDPNLTLESSPTDAEMEVPGYKFLGWISTAEVQKDSAVWKYIYDVEGDSFTTSDPDKAAPYLATDASTVTQWQDAYPVYAKYDVNYTTNLHRAGFEGTSEVNVPRYDITPNLNADTDPATATVTPDIETTVYKSGGELYKLNKVEIELPNGEVKELESDGNNSYTYPVEPGKPYTFVSYYTPIAVVYHLNDTDIDGKLAQEGNTLGSLKDGMPLPTYNVGDIDAATNAYNAFVGWTETKPASGNGYVVWSDGLPMVNTNTVVNAPMELYPVYRASAVIVQSNIDANLDNPDSVRSLSRTDSGDQISLEVRATAEVVGKDGTKYDFVGWSRDYESDSKYTLMTEDDKYPLEGSEPFKGATYTAVYKVTPYKVRYHSVDGAVIFTATVDSGDERAQDGKPGFVYTVDVPKMDESGNPVYDNDGNPVMEQKSVAYDPDAHSKIVALLDEQAAANGDKRELFLEWRYVGADGNAKSWDEFKSEPVKGDMDLYPVTYCVVANDTSDPANPVTMTAQLKWLLDPAAANTVGDSADNAPFKVCFAKPFMGNQLTVTVTQASYGPGAEGVSAAEGPVNGKFVSLYSLGSGGGSFDLANRLESKKTGEGEQGPGNAVFNFAQTHALTIVKKTTDASAMGQTFRFKVTRKASEGSPAETRMVEVKVSEQRDENGEACYVGSVQFAAPAGIYTVEEDAAWAWRYQDELSAPGKAPGKSAELTISSASSAGDAVVTCVNTRTKDKWVDGGSRAKNVWENGQLKRGGLG